MILAEIITIGDEILIGQIIDSNSAWIAQQLNKIGVSVKQITSISDDENHILTALSDAEKRASVIIITGGLGPTKDDITKKTLAKYFNSGALVIHEPSLAIIKKIFERYKAPLLEVNIQQAAVPDNCEVIINEQGTAPGMLFKKNKHLFFSLPGVPYEMMNLVETKVLPLIRDNFSLPVIIHETMLTAGVGESFLAEKIADIENSLPANIKLAYLPKLGQVRLRLSAYGDEKEPLKAKINHFKNLIIERVKEHIIATEDIPIEKAVVDFMIKHSITLSVAESCTGGQLSQHITAIPGCSRMFLGGAISYSYQLKEKILGVKNDTLTNFGAVSEEVIKEMVTGALLNFESDYAIAISGIAGPDGGTSDKPVGTVWIAIANKNNLQTKRFNFSGKRAQNIERSVTNALYMLFRMMKQQHAE